jgi:DNA (cytosine-5)-methyltransferase 1
VGSTSAGGTVEGASDGARSRPRLLDLFCGEGGAAMGYYRAGFDVFGVDLNDNRALTRHRPRPKPLKRYPFPSIEADALAFLRAGGWRGFDAIHASPPCQKFSSITRINTRSTRDHPDLIGPTRELLDATGLPYVIENVVQAPLRPTSILLCGSMFDPPLDVQRHRLFEANWPLEPPWWPCRHLLWTPRFRAADYRGRRSGRLMKVVPVYGGTRYAGDRELRRAAMEIDWMTGEGLNEAIPPRYSEFVGRQLAAHVQMAAAA